MEVRDLLSTYTSQVTTLDPHRSLDGSDGQDDNEMGTTAVRKLVETLDSYIPDPVVFIDKPFLMQSKTYFSIFRSRYCCNWPYRARYRQGQDPLEIVVCVTLRHHLHGVKCSVSCSTKVVLARTAAVLLRGTKRDDVERASVWLSRFG